MILTIAALSLVGVFCAFYAAFDWLYAQDRGREWEPPRWLVVISILLGAVGVLLLTYF